LLKVKATMSGDSVQVGDFVEAGEEEGFVEAVRKNKNGKHEVFVCGCWYNARRVAVAPSPDEINRLMDKPLPTITQSIELGRDVEWWLQLPTIATIIESASRRAGWITTPEMEDLAFVFDSFTNAVESAFQRQGIAINWTRHASHLFDLPPDLQRELSRMVTKQCRRLSGFRRGNLGTVEDSED
jgi:hypothetical protein